MKLKQNSKRALGATNTNNDNKGQGDIHLILITTTFCYTIKGDLSTDLCSF